MKLYVIDRSETHTIWASRLVNQKVRQWKNGAPTAYLWNEKTVINIETYRLVAKVSVLITLCYRSYSKIVTDRYVNFTDIDINKRAVK